ncbi:hypothetical protein [Marinovum sp.]|uniref:hypothetical protein n=1 Tax=Marinovum sp. TaxID=2024839 RepID=UPI003A90CE79
MALPTPVQAGDVVGFRFPTCEATHPHPGIVLQSYEGAQRASVLKSRGVKDRAGLQVCLVLMVSHSPPPKGQFGELIRSDHKAGTSLDGVKDIYVCYEIFDLAFVPGQERTIQSVNGPYLGRLNEEALIYYASQFREVQAYLKGKSFKPPKGVYRV